MNKINAESGVSPVIGVIMMVALTVVLAAIITLFVFGLAGDVNKHECDASFFVETVYIVNGNEQLIALKPNNDKLMFVENRVYYGENLNVKIEPGDYVELSYVVISGERHITNITKVLTPRVFTLRV
jgi:flagellin-like protein